MLKRALFFLFLIPVLINAQVLAPVKWSMETKDLGNGEYQVLLHAKLDEGWHMYSQKHPGDGIGVPASITFEENPNVKLIGQTDEIGKLIDRYSEMFQQDEKLYENKVTFRQKIKLKDAKETIVKFSAETQVCDHEKCLPPDWKDFSVKITPKAAAKEEPKEEPVADNNKKTDEATAVIVKEDSVKTQTVAETVKKDSASVVTQADSVADKSGTEKKEKKSLWSIFLLGIGGGLAALVMPCIYPMLPLTVSLFTKQSKNKGQGITKALIYGLSIIVIFVGLAFLASRLLGPSAMNEFATNPWINIGFFIVFVVFAISFFGAFEITLPASWANYTDKQADKGGYIGIFFMAFTLVLISFSCTVPIIGGLIAEAWKTGNYMALVVGALGFSLTLALPFVLFAIFPGWLNSMPKSGGWMNVVKVCIGFLELALAFKFLSNADLVLQAHWLEREVFLAIWIAIFGLMGIYLLGKFKMKMDSPEERISVPRLFFAILTFSFVIYMIPGMWGAPVKLLSGLMPPVQYAESPNGLGSNQAAVVSSENGGLIKGQKYGPHQIPAFLDMADAIEHSKKVKKPIMIDFTGHACANCRKVEERVWSDPKIKELLMNDVVLVSLYVDERTELPAEEQVYSEVLGRNLKTVGNKWTAFEIEKYQNNAQPYYIIVGENLNNYNEPMGAEYDIDVYLKWMKQGIDGYNAKK